MVKLFTKKLSVMKFVIEAKKPVSLYDILDQELFEVNSWASLNTLLKSLVKEGYLSYFKSGKHHTHFYESTKKLEDFFNIKDMGEPA